MHAYTMCLYLLLAKKHSLSHAASTPFWFFFSFGKAPLILINLNLKNIDKIPHDSLFFMLMYFLSGKKVQLNPIPLPISPSFKSNLPA